MKLETFSFLKDRGCSLPSLPQLDSDSTLVLAFGSAKEPCTKWLSELATAYPKSHIVGGSTAGEILGKSIHDDSLAVAVCRFDDTHLRSAAVSIASASASKEAGRSLADKLMGPNLRGVFVISDGISVNGSELVQGLNAVLPESTIITGGLAGDGGRFQKTWVLDHDRPRSGYISAVAFYGDRLSIGYGSKGGWDVFGPERVVTRSVGNVLYEIDGKSALGLYKLYLGDLSSGLPANALLFPLSLRREREREEHVVRTVLSIDDTAESMTFAGDVPEGSLVRFMRANFDRLVDGAGEAARLAKKATTSDVLAVAISCVGRRLVLGDRAEEEVEAVSEVLPPSSQLIGFYSYGELSPYANGRCELHNQTMTVTTFLEP